MKISLSLAAATLGSIVGAANGFAPSPQSNLATASTTSLAFFGGGSKKKAASTFSSELTDEAVGVYLSKYPVNTAGRKQLFFESWGMPESYQTPKESESIFNFDETKLRATFNTLAQLYGEDDALKMVKIQPGILAFNKDNFKDSLENFGVTFGYDEAKDMIVRNPGLLSINPANAAKADDLTMQLSYVVEFTRPVGKAGPFIVLSLLAVPALEGFLGVSRGELFSTILN